MTTLLIVVLWPAATSDLVDDELLLDQGYPTTESGKGCHREKGSARDPSRAARPLNAANRAEPRERIARVSEHSNELKTRTTSATSAIADSGRFDLIEERS